MLDYRSGLILMAKILLVEDDDLISGAVAQMLYRENFTVEVVADGLEAMERLLALDYDLVILDWNLPSMAGIDVLTRLRKAGKSTPPSKSSARAGA